MAVDKLSITNRLIRERRWTEAEEWKAERIRELRLLGHTRKAAGEMAWGELEALYPPLGEVPATVESEPVFEPPASARDKDPSVRIPYSWGKLPASVKYELEVDWVYSNYQDIVEEVAGDGRNKLRLGRAQTPAPSMAAVGLAMWAKDNRNDFYSKMVPQVKKLSTEGELEETKREVRSIAEVRSILSKFLEGVDAT